MTSELALNAYVLLGNVLHNLVGSDPVSELDPPAIATLYRKLEPLKPPEILPAIAALTPEEKQLLDRCCRYCLTSVPEDDAPTRLGLPHAVAEAVLAQLQLNS